jgi:hypothetical protein
MMMILFACMILLCTYTAACFSVCSFDLYHSNNLHLCTTIHYILHCKNKQLQQWTDKDGKYTGTPNSIYKTQLGVVAHSDGMYLL